MSKIECVGLEMDRNDGSTGKDLYLCLPKLINARSSERKYSGKPHHVFVLMDYSADHSRNVEGFARPILQSLFSQDYVSEIELLIYGTAIQDHVIYSKSNLKNLDDFAVKSEPAQLKSGLERFLTSLKDAAKKNNGSRRYFAMIFSSTTLQSKEEALFDGNSDVFIQINQAFKALCCPVRLFSTLTTFNFETVEALEKMIDNQIEINSYSRLRNTLDSYDINFNLRFKTHENHAICRVVGYRNGIVEVWKEQFCSFDAGQTYVYLNLERPYSEYEFKLDIEGYERPLEIKNVESSDEISEFSFPYFYTILLQTKHALFRQKRDEITVEELLKTFNRQKMEFHKVVSVWRMAKKLKDKYLSGNKLSSAGKQKITKLKNFSGNTLSILENTLKKIKSLLEKKKYEEIMQICYYIYQPEEIVHNKYSKRIQKRGRGCKAPRTKNRPITSTEITDSLEKLDSPLQVCQFWYLNPLEINWEEINALPEDKRRIHINFGEWVGYGANVIKGKEIIPSPWNLKDVILKPFVISNQACSILMNERLNNPMNDEFKKIGAELNTSIPLLDPDHTFNEPRLLLKAFRRDGSAQNQIKLLFTDSGDTFDESMIEAMYCAAVVSNFRKDAAKEDFELAFKALITIVDDIFRLHENKRSSKDAWTRVLYRLMDIKWRKPKVPGTEENVDEKVDEEFEVINDEESEKKVKNTASKKTPVVATKENKFKPKASSNEFISTKANAYMPDILKAFIPLVCTPEAYSRHIENINRVFFKLLIKELSDNSSKYSIESLLGIDARACEEDAIKLLEQSSSQHIEIPKFTPGENKQYVNVSISRLVAIYSLHTGIRRYLENNGLTFEQFYQRLVDREIDWNIGTEILQDAVYDTKTDLNQFITTLTGSETPEKVVQNILIVACENNVKFSKYKHSEKEILKTLKAAETLENLAQKAQEITQKYVSFIYKRTLIAHKKILMKRAKILNKLKKAEEANTEYPLSHLRCSFSNNELSFSIQSKVFGNQKQLFNFLKTWGLSKADIEDLRNKPVKFFKNLDFEKWIQEHSSLPHGFSRFHEAAIAQAQNSQEFHELIQKNLKELYVGKFGSKFKRHFTRRIFEFLPAFTAHFWREWKVESIIREAKGTDKAQVLNSVVQYLKQEGLSESNIDHEHLQALINLYN